MTARPQGKADLSLAALELVREAGGATRALLLANLDGIVKLQSASKVRTRGEGKAGICSSSWYVEGFFV